MVIEPPPGVGKNQLTSEEYVQVFEEFEGYVTNLPLDIEGTGTSPFAGWKCSYYVHLDIGSGSTLPDLRAEGSLTFNANVVGLIVAGSTQLPGGLFANDNTPLRHQWSLGGHWDRLRYGTNCGAGNDQRGLEVGSQLWPPTDGTNDFIQINGSTVNFSLRVIPQYHGAFRAILPSFR